MLLQAEGEGVASSQFSDAWRRGFNGLLSSIGVKRPNDLPLPFRLYMATPPGRSGRHSRGTTFDDKRYGKAFVAPCRLKDALKRPMLRGSWELRSLQKGAHGRWSTWRPTRLSTRSLRERTPAESRSHRTAREPT